MSPHLLLAGIGLILVGCSTVPVPIRGWTRDLCHPGLRAVRVPQSAVMARAVARLLAVARPELPYDDIEAVVVDGPADFVAAVCHTRRRATIMVSAAAADMAGDDREPERVLARMVAHELAHIAYHGPGQPRPAPQDAEREADAHGIQYFERAGYGCHWWVDNIGVRFWRDDPEERARAADACRTAILPAGQR